MPAKATIDRSAGKARQGFGHKTPRKGLMAAA
jgi:hypothetical protein